MSPFSATPVFCPTEFTVTVSPALNDGYWEFNEATQTWTLEIDDSITPAGATSPYQTQYTVSVKYDVGNGFDALDDLAVTSTDTFSFNVLIKNPCADGDEIAIIVDTMETPTAL